MTVYRYSAHVRSAPKTPAADTIMDQLSDHLLKRESLEDAMLDLCKKGVDRKYGEGLEGLDSLTSKLQQQRRQLLDEYAVEPLLDRLSGEIQSLIRRETEALNRRLSEERERINEKAESFLKKASDAIEKMEKLRRDGAVDPASGFPGLEKTFEKLFLQRHEMEAELQALDEEEAERVETLKDIPKRPADALKKLKDYEPVDPSVEEALSSLNEMGEEIAAIERVHAQPGFSGSRAVDIEEATGLVGKVLGIERLRSKLRSGNLSARDESHLSETLGPEALACAGMISGLREELLKAGYLEDDGNKLRLSPRAVRRLGQKALTDVFSNLDGGRLGGHRTFLKGNGEPDIFNTREYDFGGSFNIHLGATLMNSLKRNASRRSASRRGSAGRGSASHGSVGLGSAGLGSAGLPIEIGPEDFEVYAEHHMADCSSVLLLDLSHTMSQNGKLPAAKKVVLALDSLIRTRFPRDRLHVAGFSTYARELTAEELPHIGISPGSPFTNIQDGLRLAAGLVSRDSGRNRQVLLITDGEPSAYCKGDDLCVDYPPTEEIFEETLKEVMRLTRKGIVINTFMLDEKPLLVRFVEQMTRINRGRAFFSTPQKLGEYLLIDYLSHHRR